MRTGIMSVAGIATFLFILSGCNGESVARQTPPKPPEDTRPKVEIDSHIYRVSGPQTYENMSVFLLCSSKQDSREFITLDEGLKDGSVKVFETSNVNELSIQNDNELPLFFHEGDRLSGGKQDRTIFSSFVVPRKSGRMALPAFCIEHSRWEAHDAATAQNFSNASNVALANKSVRASAKINRSQNDVWANVSRQKDAAARELLSANSNSSLNETFDDPKVREISGAYDKALSQAVGKDGDAVGIAIVINGTVEEVNIYPNHKLLAKLYPRLLQSYAVQAAIAKKKAVDLKPLDGAAIASFIRDGKEKSKRNQAVNDDNSLLIQEYEIVDSHLAGGRMSKKFECSTKYDGKVVHWQSLNNPAAARVAPNTVNTDSIFVTSDQD